MDMIESKILSVNRNNCFGFLRLIFASLVIVSHTPELIDGNRHREPLSQFFGTISFGEFAVDCFFLVSGYLITSSALTKPSLPRYFLARIARIYPAFIVSSLICVLLVAPLAGVAWNEIKLNSLSHAARMLLLLPPNVDGTFAGTFYPALNGAAWTISYEFACYILIAVLLKANILQRPWAMLAITAASWIAFFSMQHLVMPVNPEQTVVEFALVRATRAFRLASVFLVGACYFIFRENIRFNRSLASIAITCLILSLFVQEVAEVGLSIFGGYIILFVAYATFMRPIRKINSENDISYGLYLYAWPIEKLVIWNNPDVNIIIAGLYTLVLSIIAGTISWLIVEKPIMKFIKKLQKNQSSINFAGLAH